MYSLNALQIGSCGKYKSLHAFMHGLLCGRAHDMQGRNGLCLPVQEAHFKCAEGEWVKHTCSAARLGARGRREGVLRVDALAPHRAALAARAAERAQPFGLEFLHRKHTWH